MKNFIDKLFFSEDGFVNNEIKIKALVFIIRMTTFILAMFLPYTGVIILSVGLSIANIIEFIYLLKVNS